MPFLSPKIHQEMSLQTINNKFVQNYAIRGGMRFGSIYKGGGGGNNSEACIVGHTERVYKTFQENNLKHS